MNSTSKLSKISLIVSAYNEATLICCTMERLIGYMNSNFVDREWEMILIDDGSTDNTFELMEQTAQGQSNIRIIRHRRSFGQGRGFRSAFDTASGDILVTLDADLSYEPRYIGRLIDEMESSNADIVIASPFLSASRITNVPFSRKILTIWANKFLSLTSLHGLSAITCAVRAYRADVVQLLPLNSNGMEINLEIILKAQMMNLYVTEIPAMLKWSSSKNSRRKRPTVNLLKTMFRYSFFGLLFSPNILFLVPLALMLSMFLIYGFSLFKILIGRVSYGLGELSLPVLKATSEAIRWTFLNYTHAFYFLIASLVISFFLFTVWFISKQNKFYFEQNYSLLHSLILTLRKQPKKDK